MITKRSKLIDEPSKKTSERMRKIPRKGTKIELRMSEYIEQLDFEYETQFEVLGARPDFHIIDTDVLVFCDSSFWHGRKLSDTTGESFNRNKEFWARKLIANKKRDEKINRRLRRAGWSVHRFWDTDILNKPEKVMRRLNRIVDDHR